MTHFHPTPGEPSQLWLENLDWIRCLAVRLARDEAAADDLVQRTALVALRRKEALRAASARGGVRGWLRGILHNEARAGWRKDRNRATREHDHALGRLATSLSPSDADERFELTERVVTAVKHLDEPYRTVILARYFDGRGVLGIAEALDVSPRTVETQLRRGREQLREELGRQSGPGAGKGRHTSWAALALVSWGDRPEVPLAAASASAGILTIPFLAAMNLKTLLGASAALAAICIAVGWLNLPQVQPDSPHMTAVAPSPGPADGPAPVAKLQAPAMARTTALDAPPELGPVATEAHHLEDLAAPPVGTLDVWVVNEADEPIVGAKVTLVQGGSMYKSDGPPRIPDDAARTERVVLEPAAGAVPEPIRFEGLELGAWFMEVITPKGSLRSVSARLERDEGTSKVIRFGTASVFGRVVDPSTGRQPVAGAYLSLSGRHVRTGPQGRFRMEELPSGPASLWLYPDSWNDAALERLALQRCFVHFVLQPGEERQMDFPPALAEGGAILKGRVVDADGDLVTTPDFPRRRAEIIVKTWVEPGGEGGSAEALATHEQRAEYDLDGTFELALPAGSYDVWITSPHVGGKVHVTEGGPLELPPGEVAMAEFALRGITLRGQLPEEASTPSATNMQRSVSARQRHVTWSSGILSGAADTTGAFAFYGLEPGEWLVSGCRGSYQADLLIQEGDRSASVQLMTK